jgi:predicted small lipoprotein YifL
MSLARLALLVRLALIAGGLSLALAACGRRGALEAPPTASVAQNGQPAAPQAEADDDEDGAAVMPGQTQAKKRTRAYNVPNRPFVLDPLL